MVAFPIMYYAILFPEALYFFEQVSQASTRPVHSYRFHQVMGLFFSAAKISRFFSVENLIGGKESSISLKEIRTPCRLRSLK